MKFSKKIAMKFPKIGRRGGQRPFGLFPKKHPFWGTRAPLMRLRKVVGQL